MAVPNERDKVLEMRLRALSYASDIQGAIAEYREEIEAEIRERHQEYEKSVDRRWANAIAKHDAEVSNLRAALASERAKGEGPAYPTANESERNGGWIISQKYIEAIRDALRAKEEEVPSWEGIEAVILEHEQRRPAPDAIDGIGKMVPLLIRARNALQGQGHNVFASGNYKLNCPLCSATELIDQAIWYATNPTKARALLRSEPREGERG